ncbi:MAG: response regulator, partial [Desulfobacterales bacterium]|nr:response regulator [Desulfobacterales bacterium]
KGGIFWPIILGTEEDLMKIREQRLLVDFLLIGSMIFMAFYHLAQYCLRKEDPSFLYFFQLSLLIALRTASTGERYLFQVLPGFSWEFCMKIEFLTFYAAPPVLLLFIHSLFRETSSRKVINAFIIAGCLFSIQVILTPAIVYTHTLPIYHMITICGGIYVLYVLIRAFPRNKRQTTLFCIGFGVLFATTLNDIFASNFTWASNFLVSFGLLAFMFSQTFVLSIRSANAFSLVADQGRLLKAQLKERIRMEQKLQKAMVQAEAGGRAKIEFLTKMSHEIRTPINGIIGMTELAADKATDPDMQNILTTIDAEADQLLGIIDEILDFSKIEAGKLEIEAIEFDPREIFEQACLSLATGLLGKKVAFISYMSPKVPSRLIGDPGRIRQILTNLISNAVKFTTYGEIFVSCDPQPTQGEEVALRFTVTDTGIGIPNEKINTIFEAFSQTDQSTTRKYGGTGLGTTISKQLVELMDGNIGVESNPEKGTTFWFSLHLEKAPDHRQQPMQIQPTDVPKKILVIDENQNSRFVLDSYLSALGWRPLLAATTAEAARLLTSGVPSSLDLIIGNPGLEDMNGIALTRDIRTLPDCDRVPLILLIAIGVKQGTHRNKIRHMGGCLTTPLKLAELRQKVISATEPGPEDYEFLLTPEDSGGAKIIEGHGIRVLVAEDYPTNQKIAVRALTGAGYAVTLAENGAQALDAFLTDEFDLVLMDIQMPEMDGYEATRLIRHHEASRGETGQGIPIVAMTAHAIKGYREKCLAAGMDDYITKPLRKRHFLKVVREWTTPEGKTQALPRPLAAPVSPRPMPFDYDTALAEFDGDKEFLLEVIGEFCRTIEAQLPRIRAAVSKQNLAAVNTEAHSIKGGAANLTAAELSRTAHDLELAAKTGDVDQCHRLSNHLEAAFFRFKNYSDTAIRNTSSINGGP